VHSWTDSVLVKANVGCVCISRMHDSTNHILRLTFEIHYEEHCTTDATKYFFSNRVINTVPGTTCQTWWSILPHYPPLNATFPFLTSLVIHSNISQY